MSSAFPEKGNNLILFLLVIKKRGGILAKKSNKLKSRMIFAKILTGCFCSLF